MRMKALMFHHTTTTIRAVVIFYVVYTLSLILSSIMVGAAYGDEGGGMQVTLIAFAVFMLVCMLISAQQDTRYLITRSVSRKEIFASNVLFTLPLCAVLTLLQVLNVFMYSLLHKVFTPEQYLGLRGDPQSFMAPDAGNLLIFALISFSILFCCGAASYLLGSLMARWKIPTICVLILLGVCLMAFFIMEDFMMWILDAAKFMFTDANTGLMIALKQLAAGLIFYAVAFPVMRRVTAVKKA